MKKLCSVADTNNIHFSELVKLNTFINYLFTTQKTQI